MIRRLTIENFKSIERIDLALRDVAVFVGPNASGKSNIIDVIRFVKDAVSYDLDRAISERHGIDSIRRWSRSKPYHVSITLQVQHFDGHGQFSLTLGSSKGNYRIIKEEAQWTERTWADDSDAKRQSFHQLIYSRGKDTSVNVRYQHGDSAERAYRIAFDDRDSLFLPFARASRLVDRQSATRVRMVDFGRLRQALANFEAYSIFPNTLRTPQRPSNDRHLSSIGDNLTSVFKVMQRTKGGSEARAEIISSLRHVMPNLEGIVIQSLGGLMVPSFRVKEPDGKVHDFNVSQISDGTLRILGLLTALYQPIQPATIALEEPEQTVNPGILSIIADAVRDVSSHRTQVLVTSHSPYLVDYFDPDFIYAVEMQSGLTRVGPVSEFQKETVKQRLLTLGELMAAEGLVAG